MSGDSAGISGRYGLPEPGEPPEGGPVLPEELEVVRQRLAELPGELGFRVLDDGLEVALPARLLPEACRVARGELGFRLLTNITAVDWQQRFELIYHLYRVDSAYPLLLRCLIPGDSGMEVPSLAIEWPAAELPELEVWDLMGVSFQGHPDLRRVLLEESFSGHPLRKGWEPEEELVPPVETGMPGVWGREGYQQAVPMEPGEQAASLSRPHPSPLPEGEGIVGPSPGASLMEQHKGEGGDVSPLSLWERARVRAPEQPYSTRAGAAAPSAQSTFDSDEYHASYLPTPERRDLLVDLGPTRGSVHGLLRAELRLEGQTIVEARLDPGYHHRSVEKLCEAHLYQDAGDLLGQLDPQDSVSWSLAYALAVEKLAGIEISERAEHIRVIVAELAKIASHLGAIAALADDPAAFYPPLARAQEDRHAVLQLLELGTGHRLAGSYLRFGGVSRDLPEEFVVRAWHLLDELARNADEYEEMLSEAPTFRTRLSRLGVLSPEAAVDLAASGPVMRASGVPRDVRRAEPYSIYDRFEFGVPVGTVGDCYDRHLVRAMELRESVRIVRQALRDLPAGDYLVPIPFELTPPAGDAYVQVEGPRGTVGVFLASDGGRRPYRCKLRSPGFANLGALRRLLVGHTLDEALAIVGSFDLSMCGVDR